MASTPRPGCQIQHGCLLTVFPRDLSSVNNCIEGGFIIIIMLPILLAQDHLLLQPHVPSTISKYSTAGLSASACEGVGTTQSIIYYLKNYYLRTLSSFWCGCKSLSCNPILFESGNHNVFFFKMDNFIPLTIPIPHYYFMEKVLI